MNVQEERAHADLFASASLTPDQLALWEANRSAHRFMSFKGKELIIYRIMFDKPEIQNTLTCQEVSLNFAQGMTTTWVDSNDKVYRVGHHPTMVAEGIFLWHVFNINVLYLPHNNKWNARVSTAFRSPVNYKQAVDGCMYILEKATFDDYFNHG